MNLTDRLAQIERESGCELGIFVHNLQTGEETALNADALYPMASTFKVPILVTAFQQIAAGRLRLDDRRNLLDAAKAPGSGLLPHFEAGLTPSLQDLLTLMIIISDNTATDMVMALVGGPAVIESGHARPRRPTALAEIQLSQPDPPHLPTRRFLGRGTEPDGARDGIPRRQPRRRPR